MSDIFWIGGKIYYEETGFKPVSINFRYHIKDKLNLILIKDYIVRRMEFGHPPAKFPDLRLYYCSFR